MQIGVIGVICGDRRLANIDAENLLTEAELSQFSDELRAQLEGIRRLRDS